MNNSLPDREIAGTIREKTIKALTGKSVQVRWTEMYKDCHNIDDPKPKKVKK